MTPSSFIRLPRHEEQTPLARFPLVGFEEHCANTNGGNSFRKWHHVNSRDLFGVLASELAKYCKRGIHQTAAVAMGNIRTVEGLVV
jgi:hypothetical protein